MHNRRKGCQTYILGVQLQQNVVHSGVSPQGQVDDIRWFKSEIDLAFLRVLHHDRLAVFILDHLSVPVLLLFHGRMGPFTGRHDKLIEPFNHIITHPVQAPGSLHVIGNTRHHIFAVFALRVHHGDRVQHFHSLHVAQIRGHCRGTYVNRYPIVLLSPAGPHLDDFLIHPDSHCCGPLSRAKRTRQVSQGKPIDIQGIQSVFFLQGFFKALKICHRVFESRWHKGYRINPHRWVPVYRNISRCFTHNLLSRPGLLRDKHEKISKYGSCTSQSIACLFLGRRDKFALLLLPRTGMSRIRDDSEFLKRALFNSDFAFSAGLLFTTQGFNIHPELTGCLDDINSLLHLSSSSRRLENNFCCHFFIH